MIQMKKPLLFFLLLAGQCIAFAQTSKPNIVFIMADDLGFSDIGAYGSEIKTPHLDSLAGSGVRLKQFYNTGRCCPSRASLLTGMYSHNTGMGYMNGFDQGTPGYRGDLSRNTMTIAEALKGAGYASYLSGKWHVATETKPKGPQDNWPRQRGFDRYFGTLIGSGSFYTPKSLTSDNTPVKPKKDFYLTDAIADSAAVFINDHAAKRANDPFFLYVAFTAPHWPLHAKEQDIVKYMQLYEKGWDELRAKRYKKQLQLGVIDKSYPLSDRHDSIPAWKDILVAERAVWIKRMAIYAAQVDCMDQGIGRIMQALKKNGFAENTMVVFMADNGGCAEYLSTMDTALSALGTDSSYESYRGNWANLSNTPFRLFKTRLHEGGIHTPFIVSWPGHTARQGTIIDNAPAHIIDLMPTFMDAAGASYPNMFNTQPTKPLNGVSLVSVLKGETLANRTLYWEHQANRAIRMDGWKLVSMSTEESPYVGPWELYNLKTDKTERVNLALKFPEKVKELETAWNKWASENNVFPLNGKDLKLRGLEFKRN
jgi:arylsulfatase